MKKIKTLAIATVLCGSVLFSSCMGSFNLTKSVYQFNETISGNKFVDKETVHNNSFFRLPAEDKLFNAGDMTISSSRYEKISKVTLDGDRHNPTWVYELTSSNSSGDTTGGSKRILSHTDLKRLFELSK